MPLAPTFISRDFLVMRAAYTHCTNRVNYSPCDDIANPCLSIAKRVNPKHKLQAEVCNCYQDRSVCACRQANPSYAPTDLIVYSPRGGVLPAP